MSWHPPDDVRLLDVRDGGFAVHFVYVERGLPDVVFGIIERTVNMHWAR